MRYIGCKKLLLGEIEKVLKENITEAESFCDIFSGTVCVGSYFKKFFKTITNDLLYFSYCIQKAVIENNSHPKFEKLDFNPIEYFNKLSQAIDAQGVCVAHHRDDNVETILMNLLRGTGIHGLSGMHPLSHLPIVGNDGKQVTTLLLRPLLCVSRQEIEDYLQQIGQSFVTDSSNLEADVVRNKIRLQVLPLLEEINPAARENISLSAERVDRAEQLFGEALEDRCKAAIIDETEHFVTFSIAALLHNEYILFTCLRPYGFSSTQCEDIYALLSRKEHDLLTSPQWMSASHTAVAERGVLVLFRIDDPHLAENLKPRKLPLAPENSAAAPLTYNLGAMGRYELSAVEKNNPCEG